MSQKTSIVTALAAVVFASPACIFADTITGGIHFSGDVTISTIFTIGKLSFNSLPSPNSAYTFTVDNGSGFFAGLTGFGNASNLSSLIAPINTPVDIADFLTFQDTPDTFTLTYVYGGVDGTAGCTDILANAAPGNTCSPANTPYNLQDLAPNGENSSATFVVAGFIVDGTTDNPATITFTAASTGKSYEQILNDQENGIADVITYGAQLQTSPAVPEPTTTSLMLGACLLLAGGMFRRRKTR
jgi:hypothetical protein